MPFFCIKTQTIGLGLEVVLGQCTGTTVMVSNDMLTYGGDYNPYENPDNPLVEFYDMDSLVANTETGDEEHDARIKASQFVSRYYLNTLNGTDRGTRLSAPQFEDNWANGLNLDGGIERWSISGKVYTKAMQAVNADFKEWMEDQNWEEE